MIRLRSFLAVTSILFVAALVAGTVISVLSLHAVPEPPKPVPITILPVPPMDVDRANAWTEACRLSGATTKEKQEWTRPDTLIIQRARWMIMRNRLPNRLCGQMSVFYEEPNVTGNNIAMYVEVYVRPSERKLLANVLTHEYLHSIWFNRAFYDDEFLQANPDSEEYVVNLLPNICPAI